MELFDGRSVGSLALREGQRDDVILCGWRCGVVPRVRSPYAGRGESAALHFAPLLTATGVVGQRRAPRCRRTRACTIGLLRVLVRWLLCRLEAVLGLMKRSSSVAGRTRSRTRDTPASPTAAAPTKMLKADPPASSPVAAPVGDENRDVNLPPVDAPVPTAKEVRGWPTPHTTVTAHFTLCVSCTSLPAPPSS